VNNQKPNNHPFKKPPTQKPTARKPKPKSAPTTSKTEEVAVAPTTVQSAKATPQQGERIQKVLARGGIGSRREIEGWITEGRIKLNGKTAHLGDCLKPGDHIHVNGRPIVWEKYAEQPTRVLVYHKPVGEVVSRKDPQNRPTVFTRLPKLQVGRWINVGRLDINTSGLLLFTNNGELANRLMHPSSVIDREYAVRVLGDVKDEVIERLKAGIELEDGPAKFNDVQFYGGEGANKWYHVTVSEGRNRMVRRLWEAVEITVSRLMRIRYGPIILPEGVKVQSHYEMTPKELDKLLEFVDLPKQTPIFKPDEADKRPWKKRF
jgi:23S rRNA pseudouridine2605 synthase